MPQDMPPSGGYEPVQYKRNLPVRGFKPRYYLLGMGVIMIYGWYHYGVGVRHRKYVPKKNIIVLPATAIAKGESLIVTFRSELVRERMWGRIHLIPVLQAEEDRDQVRRQLADKAREKELLGTETRVYHSDRYASWNYCPVKCLRMFSGANQIFRSRFVRPTYAITPEKITK